MTDQRSGPDERDRWMLRALAVAAPPDTGPPVAAPEGGQDVPVGAVIYGPDGTELAVGRNERELTGDPTAHAEIVALRRAAAVLGTWRLDGCALAVTLEPCTMCAGAIVLARIAVVVFGAWEPKTGAAGSLRDVLRDRRLNHQPEVYAGVREAECAALVRGFFQPVRQPRPPGPQPPHPQSPHPQSPHPQSPPPSAAPSNATP